jgi:2-phospho-L-lactate guanylyltransferase
LAQIVDAGLRQIDAPRALVLMADLPRLRADDVRQIVAPLADHDVVLVRAQDGHHTNALALSPPTAIATCFGRADSFDAHVAAAQAARLRIAVIENAGVAFDVDAPEDLGGVIRAG